MHMHVLWCDGGLLVSDGGVSAWDWQACITLVLVKSCPFHFPSSLSLRPSRRPYLGRHLVQSPGCRSVTVQHVELVVDDCSTSSRRLCPVVLRASRSSSLDTYKQRRQRPETLSLDAGSMFIQCFDTADWLDERRGGEGAPACACYLFQTSD